MRKITLKEGPLDSWQFFKLHTSCIETVLGMQFCNKNHALRFLLLDSAFYNEKKFTAASG
jgi:hypothetical protein